MTDSHARKEPCHSALDPDLSDSRRGEPHSGPCTPRALRLHHLSLALMFSCSIACGAARRVPSSTDDNATSQAFSILRASRARYRSCSTYQDTGTSSGYIQTASESQPIRLNLTFGTIFEKETGALRFEYTRTDEGSTEPVRRVMWRRSKGPVSVWGSIGKSVETMDLQAAASTLSGVSRGTVNHVLSRLFGWTDPESESQTVQIDGEEVVRGRECFRLVSHGPYQNVIIWIDEGDYSLRRRFSWEYIDPRRLAKKLAGSFIMSNVLVAELEKSSIQTSEETVEYSPVFDRPIDPERFLFSPPP